MITLTSAQQAIVKDDETVKNFVVHFPNGERADLSNSDIVFESVRFTESVCSDQSFRFGGADASCIEFETVGVGNIIGLTIQCEMQFSLSGSTVTIPYGTFVVDSCPRDHESMVHRKVTAYSVGYTNQHSLNDFEKWKLSRATSNSVYTLKPYYLFAELGVVTPDTSAAETLTLDTSTFIHYNSTWTSSSTTYYTASYTASQHYTAQITDFDAVYQIDLTGSLSTAVATLEGHNVSSKTISKMLSASICYYDSGGLLNNLDIVNFPLIDNGDGTLTAEIIYPQAPQVDGDVYIDIPLEIVCKYINSNDHTEDWTETCTIATACTLTKMTTSTSMDAVTCAFNSTLENSGSYTFYNAYSFNSLVMGFAELNAGMVMTDRDGACKLIRLDNSSPYALTADDVEGHAWWDEYTVNAIGSVNYKYLDADGSEYDSSYSFSTSESVYDMSDNYILKNLSGGTTAIVEGYIDDLFAPYASTIQFTPLEATFRGMPFLQCGDAIKLTAADGTVIDSYLLKHTFDGIQHISQDVETVQGTVIGSEVVY